MDITVICQLLCVEGLVSSVGSCPSGDLPDLLNELLLRKRSLEGLNLVALGLENILATLVDVFQEQNLDVCCLKGLQVPCAGLVS